MPKRYAIHTHFVCHGLTHINIGGTRSKATGKAHSDVEHPQLPSNTNRGMQLIYLSVVNLLDYSAESTQGKGKEKACPDVEQLQPPSNTDGTAPYFHSEFYFRH